MPTIDPAAAELAAVLDADETPTPAPAPVDVAVHGAVTITERPPRTITTDQVPVTANPAQVLNAVISRASVKLRARGGNVYIGGPSVTQGTGFLIANNECVTLDARCAVFALSPDANTSLHILSEHNDG